METPEVQSKLEELCECPICMKVPKTGQIFQCKRGHIICEKCNEKCQECPTCKLPKENIRALFVENLIATAGVPILCSFDTHGCVHKAKR